MQERAELTSEWVSMVREGVSVQVEQKPQGGRPEGGEAAAARQLGLDKNEVHRAVKIAGLSQEAHDAAVELGLDDNQDALLEAARYDDPGDQVDALKERAAKPKRRKKDPPGPGRPALEPVALKPRPL